MQVGGQQSIQEELPNTVKAPLISSSVYPGALVDRRKDKEEGWRPLLRQHDLPYILVKPTSVCHPANKFNKSQYWTNTDRYPVHG